MRKLDPCGNRSEEKRTSQLIVLVEEMMNIRKAREKENVCTFENYIINRNVKKK